MKSASLVFSLFAPSLLAIVTFTACSSSDPSPASGTDGGASSSSSSGNDASSQDKDSAASADSGSKGSDAAGDSAATGDAGDDAGPLAKGTCSLSATFSNIVGSNLTGTTPYGDVGIGAHAGTVTLCNTIPKVGANRAFQLTLNGALAAGTYQVGSIASGLTRIVYTEGDNTGTRQWISSGGSLVVSNLVGDSFTYTFSNVSMVVNPGGGTVGTGTFNIDGSGKENP